MKQNFSKSPLRKTLRKAPLKSRRGLYIGSKLKKEFRWYGEEIFPLFDPILYEI